MSPQRQGRALTPNPIGVLKAKFVSDQYVNLYPLLMIGTYHAAA